MSNRGHIEGPMKQLRVGQEMVIQGWLDVGRALNEARSLFSSSREFGKWIRSSGLDSVNGRKLTRPERVASMWGASNPIAFREGFLIGGCKTPQAAVKWSMRAARSDQRGFVYVMTNAAMPDLVKIGMTECDPEARAQQLSQSSGVPTPFAVFASYRTPFANRVERLVHKRLNDARLSHNREFFAVSPDDASNAIFNAIGGEGAKS